MCQIMILLDIAIRICVVFQVKFIDPCFMNSGSQELISHDDE